MSHICCTSPTGRNVLSLTLGEMTGAAEDWRDERVRRLDDRLYKAEEKIRELERRPLDYAMKALAVLSWVLVAAIWVATIIEIATKN
jgi:hypothetical protein